MDSQLQELLRTTRVETPSSVGREANPYSFLTFYGPPTRFNVKANKLTDFWQGYCAAINRDDGNYGIGEKLPDTFPVHARFTMKFHHTGDPDTGKPYTNVFLLGIVQCFQRAIIETLEVDHQPGEFCEKLVCAIQESDTPYIEHTPGGDFITVQIQIQFPYCKDDLVHQNRFVRPKAIENFRRYKIMSHLAQQPTSDWDTLMTPLGDIPLYRSTTRPEIPKLSMNYIVGPIDQKQVETSPDGRVDMPILSLDEVFHVDRHKHVEEGVVKSAIFSEDVGLEYWIPMFTSMNYCSRITTHREIEAAPVVARPARREGKTQAQADDIAAENDMQMATRFLHMMRANASRVTEDHFWRDIGMSLYHCARGEEEGLHAWMCFCYGHGLDPDECRLLYYTPDFQNTRLTIRTLGWYAREDAPPFEGGASDAPPSDDYTEYSDWHKSWCLPWLIKATSCKHSDVAEAFRRTYWLDYLNANVSRSGWYYFQDHIWKPSLQGVELSKKIYGDFANRISKLRSISDHRFQESTDENERDREQNQAKKYTNLIDKLKMMPFQKSVMEQSCQMFYCENFFKYLDSNPNTLGMTNCVIETCNGKAAARPGKPEDYIMMSTYLRYPELKQNMSENHPTVIKLNRWLSQVFVDDQLKHHFLKICASFLKGRNAEKKFHVWTGSGDNSKSMINKLLQITFGSFCIDFPMALLTGKAQSSSGPNPELAQSKGAHIAVLAEPDEEEKMKGGTIKRYTGGDRFFARMCNQNGGSIEAMFKTILMCNDIPPIPSGGQAVRNRLSALPFLSKWVTNPPESEEEQRRQRRFLMDPFFEEQIPTLAPAFIWLLVQYFPIYIREGIIEPPIVRETTEQYWRENDPYQNYVEESITQAVIRDATGKDAVDIGTSLTFTDVFGDFKRWYRENFPGAPLPNATQARAQFTRRLGEQRSRRWFGWRLSSPLSMPVAPVA